MGYIKELRSLIGHKPVILCSVGCLIFNERGEVLLQKREDDNKWGNPGGCMELGESIEETAKREILEETSLKIDNLNLFKIYSGEEQHHIYPNGDEAYFVNIILKTDQYEGNLNIADNESKELKFFAIEEIPENITEPFRCVKEDLKRLKN